MTTTEMMRNLADQFDAAAEKNAKEREAGLPEGGFVANVDACADTIAEVVSDV